MGKFDFFAKIGATPEAVATLNDQPILVTILVVVLVGIIAQVGVVMAIHYLTMKPEQKKKKEEAKKKKEEEKKKKRDNQKKPPAAR